MADFEGQITSSYRIECNLTQLYRDIENNRSRVRRILFVRKLAGTGWRKSSPGMDWNLTASGTISGEWIYNFENTSVVVISDQEIWVNHAADGTRDIVVSGRVYMRHPDGYDVSGTISGTKTLVSIPRATEPTVPSAGATIDLDGGSLLISLPRASSSFTHRLTYKFGGKSGTIATAAGSSHNWSIPASLLDELPDSTSGTGVITCETFNGSTKIGTETVSFKVTVASSVAPTIAGLTVSEGVAAVASAVGGYVQGQSKLSFSIDSPAARGGATVKSYEVKANGQTFTSRTGTTGVLTASGNVVVSATVTDSRGRKATTSRTVSVLAWAAPKITLLKVQRANPDGTLNDNGTSLRFDIAASVSSLTVGTQKNTLKYRVGVKQRSQTTWDEGSLVTASGTSISAWFVVSGTYSELLAFDARLLVQDIFTASKPSAAQTLVGTGGILMELAKDGVGFGKRWERGILDVRGTVYLDGRIDGNGVAYAKASGKHTFSDLTSGVADSVSVVFPLGRFAAPPNMQVSCDTAVPWETDAAAGSVSASGFTLFGRRTDSTPSLGVWWEATQMKATAAGG